MVVRVVNCEWIFEMDVFEVVVVVEVDGMEEDIEENIEDIVDFSHKVLSNLVAKIGFGVEMAKVAKEGCVPITLRWMCITLKL